MAHTDKDEPIRLRKLTKPKHRARLMRPRFAVCCDYCFVDAKRQQSARAREKRAWQEELNDYDPMCSCATCQEERERETNG